MLRLYKGYHIPFITSRKLSTQRIGPFKVLEKVDKLAYRLKLPPHWKIYPIISIAHLELYPGSNPYNHPRPAHPTTITMEGDVNIYIIEKLINRR